MEIVCDFNDAARWDHYVTAHPESRFCHLWGYRCVERAYGYRPRYFAFLRRGEIAGVLPAFEARSVFFGSRMVSQPFSEYGGLLLDEDITESEWNETAAGIRDVLRAGRISTLEMHGRQGLRSAAAGSGLLEGNSQQYAYLPLDRPIDELWNGVVTYQVRKAVQKAQRAGITVERKSDAETIRRVFFPLYVDSMMRLGVPPHNLRYYLECQAAFGDGMQIFWALRGGVPIAGLLGFTCGHRVNIINIVSDQRYWEERPNDLIHWEFIKWAHQGGYRYFDFGSVRYEGQLRYKQKWGCRIEPHAYYFLPAGAAERQETFDSSSGTMKRMGEVWSRYVPKPVGAAVGPFLRKHLVR